MMSAASELCDNHDMCVFLPPFISALPTSSLTCPFIRVSVCTSVNAPGKVLLNLIISLMAVRKVAVRLLVR